MTPQHKYLQQKAVAVMAIAPVLADYLEDLEGSGLFDGELKKLSRQLVKSIRRNDERIIDKGKYTVDKNEVIEVQVSLQREFITAIKNLEVE